MKQLLLITFLLGCLPCFSQETEIRTCRVLFLERPNNAPREAYLFDGTASHKISLSGKNFSEVIELPTGNLTLGLTPEAVLKPEDFPKGAPIISISEKSKDIYLLLGSDPKNQVFPVKMMPININDKLSAGETLWINLTNHKITAKLGNQNVVIPPTKQIVSPPPLTESGYYMAQFVYQRDGAGPSLPIMRKSWWFDATSRNLGFILGTGPKLPQIYTLRDRRYSPPPPRTGSSSSNSAP